MSASQQHKRGKAAKGLDVSEKVVVAVKASKEIPKTALVWALTHVVQPGDCIMLLVVVPPHSSGISHPNSVCLSLSLQYSFSLPFFFCRKLWGFPRFAGDCASGHRKSQSVGSHEAEPQFPRQLPSELDTLKTSNDTKDSQISIRGPAVTPTSSPEVETSFTATEAGTSSVSSSDPGTSPFFATETISAVKKEVHVSAKEIGNLDLSTSDSDSGCSSPARTNFQPWMADMFGSARPSSKEIQEVSQALDTKARISTAKALLDKFSKLDREAGIGSLSYRSELNFSGNVREAISLSRKAPPGPPPLCSICQHKAPVFGKPPRWFSYSELELATGGFSQANFLAEGGFGSVHRGVLPDGQAIAVKQHKLASSQGDQEFCSELVTGRKAARPLLKEYAINELVDPRLGNHYAEHEVPSERCPQQRCPTDVRPSKERHGAGGRTSRELLCRGKVMAADPEMEETRVWDVHWSVHTIMGIADHLCHRSMLSLQVLYDMVG
ncbi:hypothetical protein BHM03_00018642 [Ensete ventricosum]|nr:hypothetical protein BHM03_00018642 [Ensete ventricosum]